MPLTIRPYRSFPVQCAVTYYAGPFQGLGTVLAHEQTRRQSEATVTRRPSGLVF